MNSLPPPYTSLSPDDNLQVDFYFNFVFVFQLSPNSFFLSLNTNRWI